jgi:carboxyl-terminal processing protease
MIRHSGVKLSLWVLCVKLVLPLGAAETSPATTLASTNFTTATESRLHPNREDGRIAFITARLLEELHYTHKPFDESISSRFLNQYLEMFDPQRIHFLQSDLADFENYRTNLNHLTIVRSGSADTSPGYEIFSRFLQRLEQRTAYAQELLKNDKFIFDTDEHIITDRRELAYPKDLDEAKQLWRGRLRYEYLTEKISRIESEKKRTNSIASKAPNVIFKVDKDFANYFESNGVTPMNSFESNAMAQIFRSNVEAQAYITQTKTTAPSVDARTPLPKTNAAPAKTMAPEIADALSRRYHRNLRVFEDWDGGDVLQTYLTALARVYDPHSEYLGKSAAESFAMQMNLALFGIGAELYSGDDDYCTIRKLMPGGPAIKSGKIKDGDRIAAVAQGDQPPVDVVGMSLPKVVQMIRGAKGTQVQLTIVSADSLERKVISLIRDEIPLLDQAAKARLIELSHAAEPVDLAGDTGQKIRIGVIDLPSFYAPVDMGIERSATEEQHFTSVDVTKLLKKLIAEKVDGVILDLRRNGGGSLPEAIKLTGLFIKDGPVVQVSDSLGGVSVEEDTDPSVLYDGPLIVLTSRFSASASEIVAGALQDYGRALIVGDVSTHGKGTVQNVNPLKMWIRPRGDSTNDPGQLKVTRFKFYRPGGVSTQLKGVLPDIVLPDTWNYVKDIGEGSLDNPLIAGDPIPPATFEPVNRVEPYLTDLLMRSSARMATNQDFVYIREDIEQVRKLQADKTVSLNEREELKEREEIISRHKAREQERNARKTLDERIYELTLKQVDLPGLPAAVGETNAVAADNLDSKVTGTNAVTAKMTEPEADPDDNISEGERAEAARMEETERIMVDYLSLLARHNIASTTNNRSVDLRTP